MFISFIKFIIFLAFIILIIGLILSVFQTKLYRVSSDVKLNWDKKELSELNAKEKLIDLSSLMVNLVKSDTTLNRTIIDLQLVNKDEKDTGIKVILAKLLQRLEIKSNENDSIIIALTSAEPKKAMLIVNAVTRIAAENFSVEYKKIFQKKIDEIEKIKISGIVNFSDTKNISADSVKQITVFKTFLVNIPKIKIDYAKIPSKPIYPYTSKFSNSGMTVIIIVVLIGILFFISHFI